MSRALIVVDMQNSFCHPEGAMHRLRGPAIGTADVIEEAGRAVEATRSEGSLVIYTRHGYHSRYVDADRLFRTQLGAVMATGGLLRDTWDTAIVADLAPRDGDVVIDKSRFNAFNATILDMTLAGQGITELLVAGVLTNVCVESTVRSAREHDYEVTVLADCVTTRSAQLHRASLESMRAGQFAHVANRADVL